ncbi:MAG: bifunctional UDP-N-acetylglucosamine diphosphorylase/glucosamine-1-phosphate N-acetyltransferase GlmU [Candidatus Dependentiae bacterium]|jgi:bifunctional UDP-N-acetylglucosamine pyrophosphorylase/glucosamine-1-phosphate N-acetyltransferase
MSNAVHAVVLAAGKATRFGTGQSKQLVPLCGEPLVQHVVGLLRSLQLPVTVVVGHQAEEVTNILLQHNSSGVSTALQAEQRGTGHAVQCAQAAWSGEHILVVNGDMPLLTQEAVSSLLHRHTSEQNLLTFATTELANPGGYGRVVYGPAIREEKECTDAEKEIATVNAGIYVLQREFAERALSQLTTSSVTGEVYITDLVALAAQQGTVGTQHLDSSLVRGVNTLEELSAAEQLLYARIRRHWLQHGVRLIDPASILIEKAVRIGRGTVIGRGVHLQGGSVVGKQVTIEPYSILREAAVHDGAQIYSHSVIEHSTVGAAAQVGPFARLRGNAVLQERAVVGNFVEVKKSTFGVGSKAKHLAYLGDATVGERANIGAGTITCNYDGTNKHATVIEQGALVGANSSLVAPVTVERDTVVAAGSVITRDVPHGALGIGRARQENKEGWARRRSVKPGSRVKPGKTELSGLSTSESDSEVAP